MKKLFTFIVGAVVGLGAYAHDFDSGGLYYTVLSPDDKTCAVTGHDDVGPDLVIPESVSFEGEDYTVTEIRSYALGWVSFDSLTLPSTLKKLGNWAFINNESLNEVVIPNSVKEIGSECFAYCSNLNKVVLGSSLEDIYSGAFKESPLSVVEALGATPARFESDYQNAITSNPLVAVSEELVAAYESAWEGANVVPNIPAESLSFDPDSYTVQPGGTVQLNWVVSPANAPVRFSTENMDIITVDDNGLVTADKLRGGYGANVTATTLNGHTASCYIETQSLESFESDGFRFAVIPGSENEVAVIWYESDAAVPTIPASVEYNGNVYSVTTIGPDVFNWKGEVEEFVIPASIKLIREKNFRDCSSLKKVTIADSATPLELSYFNITSNLSLSEVYVGRTLFCSDGSMCFCWNDALSRIVLGPEVTSLPDNIFRECSYLNLVESQNPVPPVIGENVFGYNNPTIIVPDESVEAYQSAWEQYASGITVAVEAERLYFETNASTIYNGQSIKLPLVVEPEGATVVWSSSNPNLVSVDAEGNVSYGMWNEQVGEATITASTLNGISDECVVTAKHWLTFSENEVSMTPGSTYQAEVTPVEEIASSPITWWPGNEFVVTVDENGLITAVAPGDAEVYAQVYVSELNESVSYSIQVKVRTEVKSVEAVDPVISVWKDNEAQIRLNFEPNDEYVNRELTWTVADPEIASVEPEQRWDGYYYVRGVEVGNTTITGTTANGKTVEIEVVVKTWPQSVDFPEEVIYLAPEETAKLKFTTNPKVTNLPFSYRSEDETVATVDENGIITAHSGGNTNIFVEAEDRWGDMPWIGYQRVEVRTLPTAVTTPDPVISVWKDEEAQINIIFEPEDDQYVNRKISWSFDPEIVEVYSSWNGDYYVRGLEVGNTTITGTTVNGITVDIEVVVKTTVEQIKFAKDFVCLVPEETAKLEFTTVPELTNVNFSYSSDNDEVATVDEEGNITAHNYGSTYINVEVENRWGGIDWLGSQRVQVGIMPESVRFVGSSDFEGTLSGWTWLPIEFTPDDPNVFNMIDWTVDDPEIAVFDTDNTFKGLKFGKTAFRGIAANGDVLEGTITIDGLKLLVDGEETHWKDIVIGDEFKIDIVASSEDLLANLTYISENPEVVTVTEDGTVKAVDYGTTVVRARTSVEVGENEAKNYEAYINITVKPTDGIAFNKSKITLGQGDSGYLSIIRADNVSWSDVTWESSDENVVTIPRSNEYDAQLSYVGQGTATVTATDSYGNVATCEVTCVANIEDLTFNTDKIYVAPGKTFKLGYTTVPEMTGQTIRFESENESVATVDPETGLVTGVEYGNTYIVAIPSNSWQRWFVPVQVCNVPESVKLVGSSDYKGTVGNWTQLQIEYTPNDDDVLREIKWTVDNPEIGSFSRWDNTYAFYGDRLGTTAFRGVAVNGDVLEGIITIEGMEFVSDGESIRSKYMDLGEEFRLELRASSDDLLENVTFTTGNSEVATVTQDGLVTAMGYGSTTVRAMSSVDGKNYEASIYITVCPSEGIVLDRQHVTLTPYNSQILSVIRAANLSWSNVTWSSSNEDVVRIDWSDSYDASISYVRAGTATVTATDGYGNQAKCEVTCLGYIENITFNTNKVYVAPGDTFQLEWTLEPEGTGQTLTFESEDESIATVDSETGLVTGVSYGQTYIRVTPQSGWSRYLPVEVCNLPESVNFVGSSDYVGSRYGYTWFQIEYTPNDNDIFKDITWTVDNPEIGYIIATYDRRYGFYGENIGTTTIRGVAANGDVLEGTITIEGITFVNEAGEEIDTQEVEVGEELPLKVKESENLPENIVYTYSSDNTDVVTVSEDGVVTAVGPGVANVTVMAEVMQGGRRNIADGRNFVKAVTEVRENEWQNFEARIQITVLPSEGIALSAKKISGTEGNYGELTIIRAKNVPVSEVTWESSDEDVVTITWSNDSWASLRYVGIGTATVTATDESGNFDTCEVTCLGRIDNVIFNTDQIYVSPEKTFQLKYTIEPEGTGQTLTFESNDEAVATVDPETGLVTGVDYGQTNIRAIAQNGRTWSVLVLVCNVPEKVKFVGSSDYKGIVNGYTPFRIKYTPNDDEVYKKIKWTVDDPELGYIVTRQNETTHKEEYVFYGNKLGKTAFSGVAVNGDVLKGTITMGLAFDKKEVILTPGNTEYIKVERFKDINWTDLTWESSDENVVTVVMSSGYQAGLSYKGAGKAKVTATDRNGYVAVCEVTGTGILITPAEKKIPTNSPTPPDYNAYKLEVKVFPETAAREVSSVIWRSQDPRLVMVEGYEEKGIFYGRLISKSETGVTKVYATAYVNGYMSEASCEVTVYEYVPVTDITPDKSAITAEVGTEVQLTATVSPENASNKDLGWKSSDEDVATVDENGLVTIHSAGTVSITAYSLENPDIFATFYILATYGVGVEGVNEDEATFDVYDLNGILVKQHATADDYERLDRGIYLIKKGDKVIKVKR